MAHLLSFEIENFRVFKEQTKFEFRPITILTGTNSSGKSSLTKAIQLLYESFQGDMENINTLVFKENSRLLGNFESILNRKSDSKVMKIGLPFKFWRIDKNMTLELIYILNTNTNLNDALLKTVTVFLDEGKKELVKMELKLDENGMPKTMGDLLLPWGDEYAHFDTPRKGYLFTKSINFNLLAALFIEVMPKYLEAAALFFEIKELIAYKSKAAIWFIDEDLVKEVLDELEGDKKNVLKNAYNKWKEYKKFCPSLGIGTSTVKFNDFLSGYNNYFHSFNNLYFSPLIYYYWDEGIHESVSNILKLHADKPILEYSFLTKEYIAENKKDYQKIKEIELELLITTFATDPDMLQDCKTIDGVRTMSRIKLSDFEKYDEENEQDSRKIKFYEKLKGEIKHDIKLEDINLGYKYDLFEEIMEDGYLKSFAPIKRIFSSGNIRFIPSIRALPERYITRSGKQTYLDQILEELVHDRPPDKRKNFFKKWIQEFGIASDVIYRPIGHTGLLEIVLVVDGNEVNLADVGYGFAQLLPILITTALLDTYNILIIEEPETNLHPALQSKLADFFVDFYKSFKVQLIVESHSEYLIRKLQYLIAKQEFQHDSANIYYFYPPDKIPKGEKQVKKINFDTDGSLSDALGSGFLDEANNLSIELFQLSKFIKN